MSLTITNDETGSVEIENGLKSVENAVFATAGLKTKGTVLARAVSGDVEPWDGIDVATIHGCLAYDCEVLAAEAGVQIVVDVIEVGHIEESAATLEDGTPLTQVQLDALRKAGVFTAPVQELMKLDNQ